MVPGRCQDFRGLRWGETQVHIRPADRALPEVAKIFVKFFGSRVVPWDALSESKPPLSHPGGHCRSEEDYLTDTPPL